MTTAEIKNMNTADAGNWIRRNASVQRTIDDIIRNLSELKNALENDYDVLTGEKDGETLTTGARETAMIGASLHGMRETIYDLSRAFRLD